MSLDMSRGKITCDMGSDEDECNANAKLIAAAPDLFKALIWIESYTKDYPVELCGDEFRAWVDNARAAISKATS